MTTAIARRGVAVIVLSGDVALQSGEHLSATAAYQKPVNALTRPLDRDLDRLAELLNESNRITLLCGAGCTGAHDELVNLGDTLKAPMVHALRGKEYVEYDNPYDVG
jgi:pyruvate dehydrogenase (quinone)